MKVKEVAFIPDERICPGVYEKGFSENTEKPQFFYIS